jgi:hypothetical protein
VRLNLAVICRVFFGRGEQPHGHQEEKVVHQTQGGAVGQETERRARAQRETRAEKRDFQDEEVGAQAVSRQEEETVGA